MNFAGTKALRARTANLGDENRALVSTVTLLRQETWSSGRRWAGCSPGWTDRGGGTKMTSHVVTRTMPESHQDREEKS